MFEDKNLEILDYAINNGCLWNDNSIYYLILNNNFEMLKYGVENGCPLNFNYDYDNFLLDIIIQNENLEI